MLIQNRFSNSFKNLLKVGDIYIYKINILKLYFKHCQTEWPYCLQFLQRSDVHHYDTRYKSQFQGIRTRTKS